MPGVKGNIMAKFTKSKLAKSLLNDISLVEKNGEFVWLEFYELEEYTKAGYNLVNEEKRELYRSKYYDKK